MADTNWKKDAFSPQQPQIPGVSNPTKPAAAQSAAADGKTDSDPKASAPAATQSGGLPTWITLSIAGALILIITGVWWSRRTPNEQILSEQASNVSAATPAPAKAAQNLPLGPGEIATTDELADTWSSKKFLFRNTMTDEQIPAMIVHLPGGTYWGFSLREPYGTCEMEWVTDLQKLESEYKYRAQHAMVGDPCNHSVFDLTRYGSGPNGLVRGEIKQGAAVRPPIAIEIETKGKRLLAVRIE
jgi:hypothetical protein